MKQGEGDLEFLTHARREGLHSILSAVLEAEVLEEVSGAVLPVGKALQLRLEPEVLPCGEVVVEDDLGRDPTDPLLHVHRIPADVESGDGRVAFRHVCEAGEHLEHRGLAGPVRTEKAEDRARGDVQSDVIDCGQLSVHFRQIFGDDRIIGHGSSHPLFRQNPQGLLSHLDHDPAELVRLLRGHLAHVRLQELPGRTELSEQGRPFRTDRGLEGAEALLDLLAAAPQVRLAVAGDPIRLAPVLAGHGEIPFPKEGPRRRLDGACARLVEPLVAFLDRLDDLVPMHRTFLEQVQDETLEVALPEEMEEPAELLRAAHDASSRRLYQRMARTPPTIAYPAKTRREVAGSGTKPTSPPPGPGRTAAPPSAFAMTPDAEGGMNHGSTVAGGGVPPPLGKVVG